MKHVATEEQVAIIQAVKNNYNKDIILVNAVAGAGKTSTAQLIVAELKPKKVLYSAFNKAIIEEGSKKFPKNVECKTLHSLALNYVKPKLPLGELTYLCITEPLDYKNKRCILDAIDDFYRSDSIDMYSYMETKLVDPKLRPIAIKYILGMLEDTINPTFNFLLKYFHLLLVEKTINPQYDMIIWDELQDTSEVALEIFKELQTPYKIGLGDTDQSIYGFLNLVNGFELLHNNAQILPLTKSFRCSKDISERIEQFGKDWLNPKFTFTGTEETEADGKKAYITATNAAIIERISILHNRNEGYVLTRPLKEIFAATLALITANNGKEVLHNQYKFLNVEYKNYTLSNYNTFFEYLRKEVKDEEINSSIDLIFTLAAQKINVFNVLSTAKIIKKNKDILVSTFFSCKGLGFESVHIADDLNALCIKAQKLIMENKAKAEDHVYIKGYYVACSRAKLFLHNANI